MAKRWLKHAAVLACTLAAGCLSGGPENPSFALSPQQARTAIADMGQQPTRLQRPVVVVGGYMDRHAPDVQKILQDCVGDERVLSVSLGSPGSMAECRRKIITAVQSAYPSDDPQWTAEVDVVGVSLGGLAARYAAAPAPEADDGRRLKVVRLFTVASPHRGAVIAKNYLGRRPILWRELRPGSDFLKHLATSETPVLYTLYPYARLHDAIVGEANAAPEGQTALWVPSRPWKEGHGGIWSDPRILSDIARRLRGEPPYALDTTE